MAKAGGMRYKYQKNLGFLKERLPAVYKFLHSEPKEYRVVKGVLGAVTGLALGVALHFAVVHKMSLPLLLECILTGSFLLAFSLGFALSTRVRCILLLTLPTFFGKSGRAYIGTIALAYVLLGPVTSIMFNGEEISRTLTCGIQMSHNMSRARMNLKLQPLHHVMADLRNQARKMHKMAAHLKEVFQPVEVKVKDNSEVSGLRTKTKQVDRSEAEIDRAKAIDNRYKDKEKSEKKGDRLEAKYEKKLDFKCEDVFNLAIDGCKGKFRETEERCKKKLGIASHAFCWPLKLTAICNLAKLVPKVTGTNCEADDAVDKGFGESFITAEESANEMEKELDVNIGYKLQNNPQELFKKTPEDVAMAIKYEFTWRKRWLEFAVTILKTLLAFLFLNVLYRAFVYNKKYLSDVRHDNCYITGYFQHIDKRRTALGKRHLLPLRKLEKKSLILPKSLKLTSEEKKKLGKGSSILMMRIFFVVMVIFLDKIIYEILMIINQYSRVDYEQTGIHYINVRVNGTGPMANLVRSMFKGFKEQNYTLQQDMSNVDCLPHPTHTQLSVLLYIVLIYAAVWILLFMEAYGLRLRRLVSEFFFPKQEKKRILFLYNSLLQKREGFLRHCVAMVRRRAKEFRLEGEISVLRKLVDKYPQYFGKLEKLAKKKTKCLICQDSLGKKGVLCSTEGCKFGYCMECWANIRGVCYACRHEDDWTDTGSSNDFEVD